MARDTRKRSNQAHRHPASRQSLPGWVWGVLGLAAGLFVALLVYLQQPSPGGPAAVSSLFQPHSNGDAGAAAKSPGETTSTPADEPTHPRFEFYKLLPKQEVEVPAPEPPSASAASGRTPAVESKPTAQPQKQGGESPLQAPPQPGTSSGYLLQVGSFRHFSDADQLKANLALLGVEASIQNVKLADGETWHRVRVGPFSDRQHLDEIRKRLQVNDIQTIVLKRGG